MCSTCGAERGQKGGGGMKGEEYLDQYVCASPAACIANTRLATHHTHHTQLQQTQHTVTLQTEGYVILFSLTVRVWFPVPHGVVARGDDDWVWLSNSRSMMCRKRRKKEERRRKKGEGRYRYITRKGICLSVLIHNKRTSLLVNYINYIKSIL